MSRLQDKLEAPARLQELKPEETLATLGLTNSSTLCDIGAGTGIFTIPAAKITTGTVYAVDVNPEMLAIVAQKAKAENLTNVQTVLVENSRYPLADSSVDMALLVTVFHEIEDKPALLREVHRILAQDGKLCIIEFFKEESSFGPPLAIRLSTEDIVAAAAGEGFALASQFMMGPTFYCAVLAKQGE